MSTTTTATKTEKKVCSICKSDKTYFDKTHNRECWFNNKDGSNGVKCNKCYLKEYGQNRRKHNHSNKKASNDVYKEDFRWAETRLKAVAKRKSDIIKELAIRLEMKGMKLELICTQIATNLTDYVDETYVYKVLPAKYKRNDKRQNVLVQNSNLPEYSAKSEFLAIQDTPTVKHIRDPTEAELRDKEFISKTQGIRLEQQQPNPVHQQLPQQNNDNDDDDDLLSMDKADLIRIIHELRTDLDEQNERANNLMTSLREVNRQKELNLFYDISVGEKILDPVLEYIKKNRSIPAVVNVDTAHQHAYVHINKKQIEETASAAVIVS